MGIDFDTVIPRRGSGSIKWDLYPEDVLPLWVADMDFRAPQPILDNLQYRLEHGVFGYEFPTRSLRETVAARMGHLYGWKVDPEQVVATPGVIAGFNMAAQVACRAGEGILVQPPVYPPFLGVHAHTGLKLQLAPLQKVVDGTHFHYQVDVDSFKSALNQEGTHTGMFLLCNPHNPIGQAWEQSDLQNLAEMCLENGTLLCSDEIHSELLLGETCHVPVASLSPEIAKRTITLVAPSKTYNVPGLFCGFAIIQDEELLVKYKAMMEKMAQHVNSLGLAVGEVAYSGACDDWLRELRQYLLANRDIVVEFVDKHIPGIRTTVPGATYLAWLDCNDLSSSGKISSTPQAFFLKNARVALNEGKDFGPGGEGFVRLNFGCPRQVLVSALERMQTALGL